MTDILKRKTGGCKGKTEGSDRSMLAEMFRTAKGNKQTHIQKGHQKE